MTRAELEALSDRELFKTAADKVMQRNGLWPPVEFNVLSHEFAARVRDRIAELRLERKFMPMLAKTVYDNQDLSVTFRGADAFQFGLLNASPRAQIIAAILAVEEK